MTIKIIGAGFGRTGTTSLQAALAQLGFGKCYHMREVLSQPQHARFWHSTITQSPDMIDWDDIFDGYQSTVDWPGCTHYKTLMAAYPEAKVLLSVRDPERWYDSVLNSIYQIPNSLLMRLLKPFIPYMRLAFEMIDHDIWGGTFDHRFTDKTHAIDVFNRHNEEVKAYVPAERLLVYEVKQGWEPLCAFLNVDVPDTPFPHLNDRKEMQRVMFWGPIVLIGGAIVGLAAIIALLMAVLG